MPQQAAEPDGIDPEGFVKGPPGCVCGWLYTYAGLTEPGQFHPHCPIHGDEERGFTA